VLQFLIVLAILAAVVLVVSAPIRRARMARATTTAGGAGVDVESAPWERANASEVGELEAARDAKYREIRDAELDHRTGKLSDADFEAVDRGLRAEAVEILHELDRVRGGEGDEARDGGPGRDVGADVPRRPGGAGAKAPGEAGNPGAEAPAEAGEAGAEAPGEAGEAGAEAPGEAGEAPGSPRI
jgi:hypothetical protein